MMAIWETVKTVAEIRTGSADPKLKLGVNEKLSFYTVSFVGGISDITPSLRRKAPTHPTIFLLLRDNYLLNRWRQRMDRAACEAGVIEHLLQLGERVGITCWRAA